MRYFIFAGACKPYTTSSLQNEDDMMEPTQSAHRLRRHRFGKLWILKALIFGVVFLTALSFLVMGLWNWLMPAIFGWRMVTFWQALGLLILSKILFGGFIGRPGRRRDGHWPRPMFERWAEMTPEEREKFRERMWRDSGPFEPPAPESKS